jgi:rhodanese-related sulfurtransferase
LIPRALREDGLGNRSNGLHSAPRAWHFLSGVLAISLAASLSGCARTQSAAPPVRYVTEYGLGPDKWASAWLLVRHADPKAELVVRQPGTPPEEGVIFDLPSSELRRSAHQSTFDAIRGKFAVKDETVAAVAAIIYDIEVNYWAASDVPEAPLVEDAFRSLQHRYGRDSVTPQCYVAFFDRVYEVLHDSRTKSIPVSAERLQLGCDELMQLASRERELIHEVPIVDLLSAEAAGRKVVYVDVREADEFAEGHIPGALNIPIRDVTPALREQLNGADYVVSYCIKDFRGYEMAKALAQIGVKNSVIMRPYGYKGWLHLGLPAVGDKAMSETEGERKFDECLANVDGCLAGARAST